MTYDELVEKVAVAMYGGNKDAFENMHPFGKECALGNAKAAIDTIHEALMEPTEEMRSAAEEADWEADYDITFSDCWRAMLAASPLGEKRG